MSSFLQHTRRGLIKTAFHLARVFPIRPHKVILVNMNGKGYGDSPKAIADHILAQKLDYELVWLVNQPSSEIPSAIKQVKIGSLSEIIHLATAGFWISNIRLPYYYEKRQGQIYFQLWHGGIGIKRIERLVEDKLSPYYIETAKRDSKRTDYFISGSAFTTDLFKRAFWYDGEILELGCPRNDRFFDPKGPIIAKVKAAFKLGDQDRIILYAPTFRNVNSLDAYDLDLLKVQEAFQAQGPHKVVILVRLHPNIAALSEKMAFSEVVKNASFYPDMAELLIACDALISDYSSSMFDMMFLDTPVFMYAKDLEAFLSDRGAHFDLSLLPYKIARTTDQLIDQIKRFDPVQYQKDSDVLKAKMGIFDDGHATQRFVDLMASLHPFKKN